MKLPFIMTACGLTLLGVAVYFAPDGVVDQLRGTVTDLLRPGQQAVRFTKEYTSRTLFGSSNIKSPSELYKVEQLEEALEIEQATNRMLQIRLAQLSERQAPGSEISGTIEKSHRLVLRTLIEVAVLGDSMAEQWRAGKLLDHGSKNGLRENELVLSSRKPLKPLIDSGEDADIST